MIHIVDGQLDQILDVVTEKNVISNVHKKSLKDTLESFDFRAIGGLRYEQHLVKNNRIIIPNEDEGLVEFVIDEIGKYRDDEGLKIETYCFASYLDLKKARPIKPQRLTEYTVSMHVGFALNGTEWQPGIIESKGFRTLNIVEYTNPFAYLKRLSSEFNLELDFRVVHDGSRVVGRYVDLLERVGQWRGREVTFGKDLAGIRRTEKGDIYTALLGLGPEREDGTRLEVLVEDEDALRRWGRGKHLIETYEPQTSDGDMTLARLKTLTQTELNKRINAIIEYEANIIDLENVPGMDNKKIRFGDTVKIKDIDFNPPIYLEARIHTQERDIFARDNKNIKLGDYIEYTEDEVHAIFKQLQAEIRKRVSIDLLKQYAEPKVIYSDTPPTEQTEHVTWVDTSETPYVPKVFNFGDWQNMSPTVAGELDAYTKKQTEDRDTQALADAKAYSENADNIKSGVIDVGAVPIRTSVTGARLEWDGVNGLVQYDSNGDPVSWWDLNGEAHMSNAFVSGRIEALEGHFGDSIRIRNGAVEIVRPDGAIAMLDGITNDESNVSSYDPHYMTMGRDTFGPGLTDSFKAFHDYDGSFYSGIKGQLDGRGIPGFDNTYADVRDSMGAVVFQRYEFIHSARYLVFSYWNSSLSGKHSLHVMNGTSSDINNDRIHFEPLEANHSGTINCCIDIGKPTYQRRDVSFKIGWTNGWGPREDIFRFRMVRVIQTDSEIYKG